MQAFIDSETTLLKNGYVTRPSLSPTFVDAVRLANSITVTHKEHMNLKNKERERRWTIVMCLAGLTAHRQTPLKQAVSDIPVITSYCTERGLPEGK